MSPQASTSGTRETDDLVVAEMIRDLLRDRGSECMSQMSAELVVTAKQIKRVLFDLERLKVVERRKHPASPRVPYNEDEVRWGFVRRRWGWRP